MVVDPRIQVLPSKNRNRWRSLAVVVAVAVGGVLLLFHRYTEPPEDFSAPARQVLTEARLRLSESYSHEKEHLEQLQKAHEELHAAVMLLDKAQLDDPSQKHEIETLRSRLQALSDDRYTENLTPAELHRTYQELLAKLEAIIKRR